MRLVTPTEADYFFAGNQGTPPAKSPKARLGPRPRRVAPENLRARDPIVRRAYHVRNVIGQHGSAILEMHGEKLCVRKGSRLPKGELIGFYDLRAKVEDIEADIRDALGVSA